MDPDIWERYLKDVHLNQSSLTLNEALNLQGPLELISARWLDQVKECALFLNKVWYPTIMESVHSFPFCTADFQNFVNQCASRWVDLALGVAGGTATFKQMDEIIKLQPDPKMLSKIHSQFLRSNQMEQIGCVEEAYMNYKSLQKIRHLISPFVASLQFFSIKETSTIEKLYHFIEDNLEENWDTKTLLMAKETGIINMLNEGFDQLPQTRAAMQFLGSLVTDGKDSPLIKWLKKKTEEDMEAMGKILQGQLLEAYGNEFICFHNFNFIFISTNICDYVR